MGEPGDGGGLAGEDVGPEFAGVFGEEVVGVGVDHEPGAGFDLALELSGRPAGIAGEQADAVHHIGHLVDLGFQVEGSH